MLRTGQQIDEAQCFVYALLPDKQLGGTERILLYLMVLWVRSLDRAYLGDSSAPCDFHSVSCSNL